MGSTSCYDSLHSDVTSNCMPSKRFKPINSNIPHLNFLRFFQTISDKNYGKNCYLDNFLFLPLPLFNNVEKLRAIPPPTYVMGSQHCIEGRGGVFKYFFKIPIIFCHWLNLSILLCCIDLENRPWYTCLTPNLSLDINERGGH